MSKIKLLLDSVHKSYDSVAALHPCSLQVTEGEFLTLLGPSGSGKTTLLQCVAGLITPDGGRIEIEGVDATRLEPSKRDIGMVFQNYALFPHMTVFENIAFPLRMRGMKDDQVRKMARRALSLVRLSEVEQRLPRQLSGGQQQRIALARCIVYEPALILMDEPLGALDKKLREQMQYEIKRIHQELGATILYVTHDQDEAMTMSDRICLMNGGRIAQLDTPHDLYHEPESVYAADFLGESNLLPGLYVQGCFSVADAPDLSLQGRPLLELTADQPAWCLIRPQSVRFLAPGESADNELDGVVIDSVLVGGITRYRVRPLLAEHLELILVTLSSSRHAQLPCGARVHLGIDQAEVKFLAQ